MKMGKVSTNKTEMQKICISRKSHCQKDGIISWKLNWNLTLNEGKPVDGEFKSKVWWAEILLWKQNFLMNLQR